MMQSAPAAIRIEVDPCVDDLPPSDEASGLVDYSASAAAGVTAGVSLRCKPQCQEAPPPGVYLQQLSPPARSRRSRSLPSVHGDLEGEQLQCRLMELSIQQQEPRNSSLTERLPEPAQKVAIDAMPLPVDSSRQRRKSFDFSALQNLGSIQEQE